MPVDTQLIEDSANANEVDRSFLASLLGPTPNRRSRMIIMSTVVVGLSLASATGSKPSAFQAESFQHLCWIMVRWSSTGRIHTRFGM